MNFGANPNLDCVYFEVPNFDFIFHFTQELMHKTVRLIWFNSLLKEIFGPYSLYFEPNFSVWHSVFSTMASSLSVSTPETIVSKNLFTCFRCCQRSIFTYPNKLVNQAHGKICFLAGHFSAKTLDCKFGPTPIYFSNAQILR